MSQNPSIPQRLSLSSEAQELANTYHLGTPLQEYKAGYSSLVVMAMLSGIGLAALFGFLGYEIYNSPPVDMTQVYAMLAFVIVGILAAIYFALYPIIYHSWRVYVCTDGFVSTRWGKAKAFRWDQITEVYNQVASTYKSGIKMYTLHHYVIRDQNGSKLLIKDDYRGTENLGNTILQETTNVMLPRAMEQFNTGGMVNFGPLSLSQQGLHKGNDILPWDQVKDITINKGMVTIDKQGRFLSWASIRSTKIANPIVFLKLLEVARNPQARNA